MDVVVSRRESLRIETCLRKRRYPTWEAANDGAMLVWAENPKPRTANPCTPYPCDIGGERHYHYGHIGVRRVSA